MSREQFQKGQCVLYGARAVCRVAEIGALPFGEKSRLYYTLRPLFENHGETIYVPMEGNMPMRYLIDIEQARQLISGAEVTEEEQADDPVVQKSILQSQNCGRLMGCVRTLRQKESELRRSKKHLHEAEQRFLEQAEKLLYGELAVVLETTPENVREQAEAGFRIGK